MYYYVAVYVRRIVIANRKEGVEPVEIVQKHDPDRLDYYRIDLKKMTDTTTPQLSRSFESLPPDLGII